MKRIIGTKGIGKSAMLLAYASDEHIPYILCRDVKEFEKLAEYMGIEGVMFIPYNDRMAIKKIMFLDEEEYLIDNVEEFIEALAPTCLGYTINI